MLDRNAYLPRRHVAQCWGGFIRRLAITGDRATGRVGHEKSVTKDGRGEFGSINKPVTLNEEERERGAQRMYIFFGPVYARIGEQQTGG
jgi:hypothetical protein